MAFLKIKEHTKIDTATIVPMIVERYAAEGGKNPEVTSFVVEAYILKSVGKDHVLTKSLIELVLEVTHSLLVDFDSEEAAAKIEVIAQAVSHAQEYFSSNTTHLPVEEAPKVEDKNLKVVSGGGDSSILVNKSSPVTVSPLDVYEPK